MKQGHYSDRTKQQKYNKADANKNYPNIVLTNLEAHNIQPFKSAISPERNYINQRLNSKIFYSEQISAHPPEHSLEQKGTSIQQLVLLELASQSTKNPYLMPNDQKSSLQSVQDGSRKRSIDQLSQQSSLQDFKKNNNMRVMIQMNEAGQTLNEDLSTLQSKQLMTLQEIFPDDIQISKEERISTLQNNQTNNQNANNQNYQDYQKGIQHYYSKEQNSNNNYNQQQKQLNNLGSNKILNNSQMLSIASNFSPQPIKLNPSRNALVGNGINIMQKKRVVQRDPILLSPYRQISSSFIVTNKDRFGNIIYKRTQQNDIPGPGQYDIKELATQQLNTSIFGNYGSTLILPKGKYQILRARKLSMYGGSSLNGYKHQQQNNNNIQISQYTDSPQREIQHINRSFSQDKSPHQYYQQF